MRVVAAPTSVAKPMPVMPENIWLDIFNYLTLEEKFKVSSTCRTWHRILADPSLYIHIELHNMEFNTLVQCLQQLSHMAPRMRSLRIAHCHSSFISETTVPVKNTSITHHSPQQPGIHSLHTHITSCTLPRRREEYRKLGFTLHQDFSRALAELMEVSQGSIRRLEIQDNFLDLEMTELIFCIVRFGRHLEHLLYDANRDGGFITPEIVSAITGACPNICSFRGQHAISDTVLDLMKTGWTDLRSITLAPYQSSTMGTKEVSLEGLWSLLVCGKVENLELLDLNCISNENVRTMVLRVKDIQSMSMERTAASPIVPNHPFAHLASQFSTFIDPQQPNLSLPLPSGALPGASVKRLILTKYTSTPLTLPGFGALLKLFPNLESFQFTTNFFTYDHQFQGLTEDIYEQEIVLVERMILAEMSERWATKERTEPPSTCWIAEWHAPVTQEQRLRAGMMFPPM
ncbi:hypothetical protein BGZ51_009689 [Haplosporangium sp. Z 767]|nr:hypothetical protein BGZ51_009689 [Haplosporangium sp. Z 767]KAF9196026.1 hypothetical protein BGZ50_002534 [Haplosporangium sp. Z 11]